MQLLQKPIKLCEGLSFGDRRLLVHLVDVLKNGRSSCVVHTVDTDVVIILIGKFFSSINYHKSFASLWYRKSIQLLPPNSIFHSLGESKSLALPVFNSLLGFFGKGKKLAWET